MIATITEELIASKARESEKKVSDNTPIVDNLSGLNVVEEQEEDTTDPSKQKKEYEVMRLKYYADFNSATFFSLTFEYKWRYSYSNDELAGFLMEAFSLMALQLMIASAVMIYGTGQEKTDGTGEVIDQLSNFSIQISYMMVNIAIHH